MLANYFLYELKGAGMVYKWLTKGDSIWQCDIWHYWI